LGKTVVFFNGGPTGPWAGQVFVNRTLLYTAQRVPSTPPRAASASGRLPVPRTKHSPTRCQMTEGGKQCNLGEAPLDARIQRGEMFIGIFQRMKKSEDVKALSRYLKIS